MHAFSPATGLSYPEIAPIFEEVFGYAGELIPSTTAENVEKWDSLQHIGLIRALEATFSIRMSMDEMMEIRSVADIENVLRRHGV